MDRSIRASDADREGVAASLRDHYAAGRLTADEFNERLDKAYTATTMGDLADLQTDLPAAPAASQFPSAPSQFPSAASQFPPPYPNQVPVPVQPPGPVMTAPGRFPEHWRGIVGSWLSISLACFVVWLLSGHNGSWWFLWPAGVFGAITVGRLVSGGQSMPGRRQYRRDYRRQRRGY